MLSSMLAFGLDLREQSGGQVPKGLYGLFRGSVGCVLIGLARLCNAQPNFGSGLNDHREQGLRDGLSVLLLTRPSLPCSACWCEGTSTPYDASTKSLRRTDPLFGWYESAFAPGPSHSPVQG